MAFPPRHPFLVLLELIIGSDGRAPFLFVSACPSLYTFASSMEECCCWSLFHYFHVVGIWGVEIYSLGF